MPLTPAQAFLPLLLTLMLSAGFAQCEVRLETPGALDLAYMQQQVALVDDLAARQLGRRLQGNNRDLALLQQLLDRQLVKTDDDTTMQAMGIVMGNLLAAEYNLDWVIYKDELGRSRALRIDSEQECLFPSTMISRRAGVGIDVDVQELYDRAGETVMRVRSRGIRRY